MDDQTKIVITGRGQDPSGFVGRTFEAHDQLFAALDIGDPAERSARIKALVGAGGDQRVAINAHHNAPRPDAHIVGARSVLHAMARSGGRGR